MMRTEKIGKWSCWKEDLSDRTEFLQKPCNPRLVTKRNRPVGIIRADCQAHTIVRMEYPPIYHEWTLSSMLMRCHSFHSCYNLIAILACIVYIRYSDVAQYSIRMLCIQTLVLPSHEKSGAPRRFSTQCSKQLGIIQRFATAACWMECGPAWSVTTLLVNSFRRFLTWR